MDTAHIGVLLVNSLTPLLNSPRYTSPFSVTSSVRITCGLAVVCVFSPGDALSFLVFLFGGRPRGFAKRTSEATLGGGANLSSDSSCLKKRGRWSCV